MLVTLHKRCCAKDFIFRLTAAISNEIVCMFALMPTYGILNFHAQEVPNCCVGNSLKIISQCLMPLPENFKAIVESWVKN